VGILFTNYREVFMKSVHRAVLVAALVSPFSLAAPPGITLKIVMDQDGANAGVNGNAWVHNDSDTARNVKYRVTVNSAQGKPAERTVYVAARSKERLGYTCAFDVSYTTQCGSSVSYVLLD
jgi:hypothetical protein